MTHPARQEIGPHKVAKKYKYNTSLYNIQCRVLIENIVQSNRFVHSRSLINTANKKFVRCKIL